jgi:Na+-transporting NADH:ubiquinone oxidoreductase subunit C
MDNDNPLKALLVVTTTALVCSILVTVATVKLQPIQKSYQNLERNRAIVQISGLTNDSKLLSDREIVSLFQKMEAKIIDLKVGRFDTKYNPSTFETWKIDNDPELSVAIPAESDIAKLSRRSELITVFLVKDKDKLERLLLPISGQGMWSKIYGFIALETDLNTIADIIFYKQAETSGIGDKILNPDWQSSWRTKQLYDDNGILQIGIQGSQSAQNNLASKHQVDAITGATVTVDAVKNLVSYWFGSHAYKSFLDNFRSELNK